METLWAHFRINDIRLPEPAKILQRLHGEDLLTGRIIDFCGNDAEGGRFALLEVEGFSEAVVVSVSKLVPTSGISTELQRTD